MGFAMADGLIVAATAIDPSLKWKILTISCSIFAIGFLLGILFSAALVAGPITDSYNAQVNALTQNGKLACFDVNGSNEYVAIAQGDLTRYCINIFYKSNSNSTKILKPANNSLFG